MYCDWQLIDVDDWENDEATHQRDNDIGTHPTHRKDGPWKIDEVDGANVLCERIRCCVEGFGETTPNNHADQYPNSVQFVWVSTQHDKQKPVD